MLRYLWLTLAENPAKARFLTPAERIWLQRRNAAQKVVCCCHIAPTQRGPTVSDRCPRHTYIILGEDECFFWQSTKPSSKTLTKIPPSLLC